MGKYFAEPAYTKASENVFSYDEFEAFCEVYNTHADVKIAETDEGAFYESLKYRADGAKLTKGFIIWDKVKGNIWFIYAKNGDFVSGSLSCQGLANFASVQWHRFIGDPMFV